jgi:hypothetical protein
VFGVQLADGFLGFGGFVAQLRVYADQLVYLFERLLVADLHAVGGQRGPALALRAHCLRSIYKSVIVNELIQIASL